jgi:hypothetical protein
MGLYVSLKSIGTTEPTAGPSTAALAIKLREPPLRMTLFMSLNNLADSLDVDTT